MFLLPDYTPFQTALLYHKLSLLLLKALYSPTIFREPKTYFLTFLCKCNTHPTHHCSSSDCTDFFSRQDVLQAGCFGRLLSSEDWVQPCHMWPQVSLQCHGQMDRKELLALGWLEQAGAQATLPFPRTSGRIHTLHPICHQFAPCQSLASLRLTFPSFAHGGCQSCHTTKKPPVTLESGHLIRKKMLPTSSNTPSPTGEDSSLFQGLFTLRWTRTPLWLPATHGPILEFICFLATSAHIQGEE